MIEKYDLLFEMLVVRQQNSRKKINNENNTLNFERYCELKALFPWLVGTAFVVFQNLRK